VHAIKRLFKIGRLDNSQVVDGLDGSTGRKKRLPPSRAKRCTHLKGDHWLRRGKSDAAQGSPTQGGASGLKLQSESPTRRATHGQSSQRNQGGHDAMHAQRHFPDLANPVCCHPRCATSRRVRLWQPSGGSAWIFPLELRWGRKNRWARLSLHDVFSFFPLSGGAARRALRSAAHPTSTFPDFCTLCPPVQR